MLRGRYAVGTAIGQGGFGITYIAWDESAQIPVAIKEFFPVSMSVREEDRVSLCCYSEKEREIYEKGVRKLIDEAERLAKFSKSKNIVNVLDYFEDNKTAYIVMEYLDGQDLKALLRLNRGRLDPERAVRYILPVIDALQDMHKENMIHRDVSPDNIFICRDDSVKLLDFGSARLAMQDDEKSLTVFIKPGYAPQEQYLSRSEQGTWTDIYAVCATLYKMITGETPPPSIEREREPLKTFADCGIYGFGKLERVIRDGMALDRSQRIQTAKALKKALTDKRIWIDDIVDGGGEGNDPPVTPPKPPQPTHNRFKVMIAVAAAVAVVLAGLGAYMVFARQIFEKNITQLQTKNVHVGETYEMGQMNGSVLRWKVVQKGRDKTYGDCAVLLSEFTHRISADSKYTPEYFSSLTERLDAKFQNEYLSEIEIRDMIPVNNEKLFMIPTLKDIERFGIAEDSLAFGADGSWTLAVSADFSPKIYRVDNKTGKIEPGMNHFDPAEGDSSETRIIAFVSLS